ncbi:MAG TPA: MoxR family ATPase [Candidatus Eisenbergiella intestinipullorum]|nr:MoxR family ATPase [Candidatus Eisenbergiella intestinipullorum]
MREEMQKVMDNVGKVIIGREDVVRKLLAAILADGHVLLEDVPGTGKTKLAKAIAASLGIRMARIQFTPDMLPADITGLQIYSRQKERFELKKGPVFTNILLADEINRATPRTQAGLLECMEERQVTIDGETLELERPFFVIATQNPVETAGTFPLPEAQTDRFMMKLAMGFPDREEETAILQAYSSKDPLEELQPVMTGQELLALKEEAQKVYVHPLVAGYLADIAAATRKQEKVAVGVSPRGTLALMRAAKAMACMEGRDYLIPDDVKALAPDVLSHRLIFAYGSGRQEEARRMMEEILAQVPVPVEDFGRRG